MLFDPRGKNLKKIPKMSRGAPSVSRIRTGLFGAFRWSPGVSKYKFKNLFSKISRGGPSVSRMRSGLFVPQG